MTSTVHSSVIVKCVQSFADNYERVVAELAEVKRVAALDDKDKEILRLANLVLEAQYQLKQAKAQVDAHKEEANTLRSEAALVHAENARLNGIINELDAKLKAIPETKGKESLTVEEITSAVEQK